MCIRVGPKKNVLGLVGNGHFRGNTLVYPDRVDGRHLQYTQRHSQRCGLWRPILQQLVIITNSVLVAAAEQ